MHLSVSLTFAIDVLQENSSSKIEKIHHKILKKLSMNQMIVMTIYCFKVTRSLYIKDILDF